MDPLIKSQLLYQLSYAPAPNTLAKRHIARPAPSGLWRPNCHICSAEKSRPAAIIRTSTTPAVRRIVADRNSLPVPWSSLALRARRAESADASRAAPAVTIEAQDRSLVADASKPL